MESAFDIRDAFHLFHTEYRHSFSTSKSQCPTSPKRKCPLPGLSWADPAVVWKSMCECDARASMKRNPHMFDNHPSLQSRMRAILLDWLNEVCNQYFFKFLINILLEILTCGLQWRTYVECHLIRILYRCNNHIIHLNGVWTMLKVFYRFVS